AYNRDGGRLVGAMGGVTLATPLGKPIVSPAPSRPLEAAQRSRPAAVTLGQSGQWYGLCESSVSMSEDALPSLPWTELVRRTVREAIDDDCLGLAAQLAYYLCL